MQHIYMHLISIVQVQIHTRLVASHLLVFRADITDKGLVTDERSQVMLMMRKIIGFYLNNTWRHLHQKSNCTSPNTNRLLIVLLASDLLVLKADIIGKRLVNGAKVVFSSTLTLNSMLLTYSQFL